MNFQPQTLPHLTRSIGVGVTTLILQIPFDEVFGTSKGLNLSRWYFLGGPESPIFNKVIWKTRAKTHPKKYMLGKPKIHSLKHLLI